MIELNKILNKIENENIGLININEKKDSIQIINLDEEDAKVYFSLISEIYPVKLKGPSKEYDIFGIKDFYALAVSIQKKKTDSNIINLGGSLQYA
jgi:hypothetical protein